MSDNKLKKVAEKYNNLIKEIKGLEDTDFHEYFKESFEKYPNIKEIHLFGYVPGFNDGDPCTFSFQDPEVLFNDFDYTEILKDHDGDELEDIIASGSGNLACWAYPDDSIHEQICKELNSIANDIDPEIYNLVFGNYFHLTITKESITKDDYECGY